jgi:hypothetical protein
MAMPQRVDGDACDEIEVRLSLVVLHAHALASLEHDRAWAVDGKHCVRHGGISL